MPIPYHSLGSLKLGKVRSKLHKVVWIAGRKLLNGLPLDFVNYTVLVGRQSMLAVSHPSLGNSDLFTNKLARNIYAM